MIWKGNVAKRYKLLLAELGVPYSASKSLSSDSKTVRVEYAKRLFLNHHEITPLNPKLLTSACRSIYDLFLLGKVMSEKG